MDTEAVASYPQPARASRPDQSPSASGQPIPDALSIQCDEVERLHAMISRLDDRLGSVMAEAQDKAMPRDGLQMVVANSPVASSIQMVNERVRAATDRLGDLFDRLEL